jgi:predicted ATP-binding protein involved in virulence
MKVKSLTLRSFRGIDDLTLDFDQNVNVLIGINGVGKSSILDALAFLLLPFLNELGSVGLGILRKFQDTDISSKSNQALLKINVDYLGELNWSVQQSRQGKYDFSDQTFSSPEKIAATLSQDLSNDSTANLPLFVFYPISREVASIAMEADFEFLEKSNPSFSRGLAYNNPTLAEQSSFQDFFTWFKRQEDLENELRLDHPDYRDRRLEAVRTAIPEFLPGFSNLRVRRSAEADISKRSPLRMTVQKQGQELIINQLSDGEKCLLAMVGDLARRLAIANPGLPDPLQGQGVVLIDEIELHLHPKWQRNIVPVLTRTFPNCQFIVTTHSPQVLGEVKGKVYRLKSTPNGIIAESLQTYGRDSNQILEDVMDVPERSLEFKNKIRHLFRLIEDGNLDEAKSLQQELEDLIGYEEPEFVKAEILIRRKEVLGR